MHGLEHAGGRQIAYLDPKKITVPPYEIKVHDIQPSDIVPNGDRYIVEVCAIDEMALSGGGLIIYTPPQQLNPRDPASDPTIELRGVIFGIIVSVGNGHILGYPDTRILHNPGRADGGLIQEWVERVPADVPMFFEIGDVVVVDKNAKGRDLKIMGKEARTVNQIDILGHIPKLKVKMTPEGWKPVADD